MATRAEWHPVDIRTEYDQLVKTRPRDVSEYVTSEAQRDLGGNFSSYSFDERHVYLPSAEQVIDDNGKVDISRGLGGLGLIAMKAEDLHAMDERYAIEYAAAIINFDEFLGRRSSALRAADQFPYDHNLATQYPAGKTDEWAHAYSGELRMFQGFIRNSQLFQVVQDIRTEHSNRVGNEKEIQLRGTQKYGLQVLRSHDGRFKTRHESKQPRRRVA